jgi:hypothetical protein
MHKINDGRLLSAKGPAQIRHTLGEVLPNSWEDIPEETFAQLLSSMPRRIQAVIEADGWYTKY